MSMLTPPGMGGRYRITGNKYPRLRRPRRRRRLVSLTAASVAVLGVTGWGTLQLIDVFTGGGEASAAGTPTGCATETAKTGTTTKTADTVRTTKAGPSASPSAGAAGALPKPKQITVNVLNATPRSGLAKQTAEELKKRGFRIGEVGNATKQFDKKIKGTGILLGPASSLSTSLTVLATQLPGAERRADTRKGDTVDLVIGDGFKGLAKKADAERALAALTAPKPTPTPKKSC